MIHRRRLHSKPLQKVPVHMVVNSLYVEMVPIVAVEEGEVPVPRMGEGEAEEVLLIEG
jgi:hypothetical protein